MQLYLLMLLFVFRLDSSKIFWEALVIVVPFLSFKVIIHAYLLNISITHNKKGICSLSNLLIDCVSTRLAAKILAIKDEYTFCFLSFLIIGLRNSWAHHLFLFLIPLPANLFRAAKVSNCARLSEKFVNHWSKSTLMSIKFWIFNNIKKLFFW